MLPFAGAISEALLGEPDAELARIAIGGLWIFTLYEYLVSLFRLDERARAYFFFTFANVLVAIPLTVFLVVVEDQGASGLLGTYGAAVPFVAWVAIEQRRRLSLVPKLPLLRRMLRFGFPTMPAELSLYSLSFIDRIVIARLAGLAEAGLYALAVKFSQAVNVLVRGFQLAWPPLAYSVVDDDGSETRLCTGRHLVHRPLHIRGRRHVALLTLDRPHLHDAGVLRVLHEAIGLVSTGVTLYALYLVLVVILGRTGRTEFDFRRPWSRLPPTSGSTCCSSRRSESRAPAWRWWPPTSSCWCMWSGFTQRLFAVPYEWRRLAMVVGSAVVLVAGGELLLPTEGFAGLAGRTAVWFAFPLLLWFGGFLEQGEREALGRLLDPATLRERLSAVGASATTPGEPSQQEEGRGPRLTAEVYEAERRDEDSRL